MSSYVSGFEAKYKELVKYAAIIYALGSRVNWA